ncbi:transglycosylase [Mobiluncus mulieris]|uniref:transglycosylase n=1 Tax=Mobiluncus mulieris TaxID=2052 RepID=UPI000CB5DEAD|nr:transglycosylase [Mobiluncus mulieris]PNL43366.1 transglycosylase [Mobiluncus mulieris]
MIDYLTPFEGVVFGGIIALGILAMLSPEDTTQMIGAILLTAGFWGGVIALIRGLLHREPGSLYLLSFVGALISGLVKFFVFPDFGQDGESNVIWAFIVGIGIAGIVGTGLNALIRKPPEEPENTLETPSQTAEAPPEMQPVPLPGKDTDDTVASSNSESS